MSHALLGPSSAKQWMTCTPSARFGELFPDRSSSYADEGSAAHELAEICISGRANFLGLPGTMSHEDYVEAYGVFTLNNKYFNDEMDSTIKLFAEWVFQLLRTKKNPILLLEQKLDLSRWIPSGFGTGDVIIIDDTGLLEVIDLKYGKGVPVDPKGNPQLKCYGLGALEALSVVYDINRVKVTIYQARLLGPDDEPGSDEYTTEEIVKWADNELAPAAKAAWEGHGDFVPGDHCRFCRGRAHCDARIEQEVRNAFDDNFETPEGLVSSVEKNVLSEEDFLYWLGKADAVTKALASIKDEAAKRALSGTPVPGYKLVEGRSNRVFTELAKVTEVLEKQEDPNRFFKPVSLISLGAVEKTLGAPLFKTLLGKYVVKPKGKPTLVPEADKRPAMSPDDEAMKAFGEEDDDE